MKRLAIGLLVITTIMVTSCGQGKVETENTGITEVGEIENNVRNESSEVVEETFEVEEVEPEPTTEPEPMDISWFEEDSSIMLQGIYCAGKDIAEGNYIFTCKSEYVDVLVFEDMEAYYNYHKSPRFTVGEETDAREQNAKSIAFIWKDENTALNIKEGNVVMISSGYGAVGDGASQSLIVDNQICNGTYEAGTISAGLYAIGCPPQDIGGITFVVFDDAESYANFDSAEKYTVGKWSTAAELYAKYDLYLDEGELCYVNIEPDDYVLVDSQGILNLFSITPSWKQY